ncbi:MAG: alpha/beta hydrolase [Actinomycetota bacterium]|nr:alpha/beta hydrolase [Actinomycetota bacterium]
MHERRAEIAGTEVAWLEDEARTPVLYVHGVPNSGVMWRPFLERTGGFAPDLPGFGTSAKSAGFDYSIKGYGDFLEAYVDHVGLDRFALVMHDWGGVGLELAMRRPAAVERLVLIDLVPFLPGYRWHRIASVWRTPVAGELFMGFSTKWAIRQALKRERAMRPEHVRPFVDEVYEHFDHGTQRAILKLYRSSPPDVLARAGERLGDARAPALVLWGEGDHFLPTEFAHAYGEALGGRAEVEIVPEGLHWIWLEQPRVVDTVADFVRG